MLGGPSILVVSFKHCHKNVIVVKSAVSDGLYVILVIRPICYRMHSIYVFVAFVA